MSCISIVLFDWMLPYGDVERKVIRMTEKLGDMAIVQEAVLKFGDRSDRVKSAISLHDMAVALRALASANELSNSRLCNEVLSFQEEHELQGVYDDPSR